MGRVTLIIFCILGLIFDCGLAGARAIGKFRIGDWVGSTYRNDHTRRFDHCAARSTNADGITIIYSLDRSYIWSFELSNPNWNFARGASFKMIFRLNKHESVGQRAYALSNNLVRVNFSNSLEAFIKLSRVLQMDVIAGGIASHFNLSYGPDVLVALTRCVNQHERAARNIKDLSPVLRATSDPAMIKGAGKDAIALAAKIVKLGGVKGAKLLPQDEVPVNLKADVFWKVGPLLFGVSALTPGQAPEMSRLPGIVIQRDSQLCRGGEFFAGATFQRSDLPRGSDAPSVARAYTFCQIPGTRTSAFYIATPRKRGGGFYLIETVGRGSEFSPAIEQAANNFDDAILSVLKEALE